MTDDNRLYRLSRRKVLAGLGGVGLASAGAGLGTTALFSDTESFDGNTITAGTLDLLVGYYSYWDQGMAGSGQVSGTQNGDGTVSGELTDVKPGDSGILAFCPQIKDNPAYLWLCGELTANAENGMTEPEGDVDDTSGEGNGELAQSMEVTAKYCDLDDDIGDDGFTPDDIASSTEVWTGTLADFLSDIENGVPLDGSGTGDGFPAPGDQACFAGTGDDAENPCLCLEWDVPTDVGNEIQSDSLAFDLEFHADQCRHNDGTHNPCAGDEPKGECPGCEVDTAASQSSEVTVQSTDASSFPQVSTFLNVDTTAGMAGDLTADDFSLCEAGCGQDIDVAFTSEEKPVDFVFLMDVTGSMGGELDTMKTNVQDFIDSVEAEGIDARYALYLFGDEEETGPPAVFLKQEFTSDATTFKNAVQNTSLEEEVGYGGDGPEDNYEAILTADNDLSYRSGAQRVMVDITDAPGEEDPGQTIGGLAETRANAASVLDDYTYIAVSPDVEATHQKKTLADDVGGTWIEILEDLDPILDDIVTAVTTSYRIQYTTANPVEDGSTRNIVVEITDPDEGTLYATTSYTAPS
jgi:predicted ribosomally synthesized peptide with SipW-like signal peptide